MENSEGERFKKYGVVVNFYTFRSDYYDAYCSATKENPVFTWKVFVPYDYNNGLKGTVDACKQQWFTPTKLTFPC